MGVNVVNRSLLTLLDWNPEEIRYLLDLSHQVKKQLRSGKIMQRFRGKTLALIFEKRSTRTRSSFETAFGEEGGSSVFLSQDDIHLGVKESLEDTARVLGRMFSAIQFRGFKQSVAEKLAEYAGIPVYNGLTDDYHPTQALADMMTIEEAFKGEGSPVVTYVGDGMNNVAVSLMIICSKLGVDFRLAGPKEYFTPDSVLTKCRAFAAENDSKIEMESDPSKVIPGSDFIYTDVWVSMGEEKEAGKRKKLLEPYRVNAEMMKMTGKENPVFLHCLPAVKGQEVTEDVFEGPGSLVFDQAENRKHTIKALMLATLGLE